MTVPALRSPGKERGSPEDPPRTPGHGPAASTFSHRRLTLNSLSNTFRYFIMVVITFFLTPFLVRTLGDSLYGIWVVISSFIGYSTILELGLQRAVVKLVAENRAVGNVEKMNELISSAFGFFLSSGLIMAAILSACLPLFIHRFARNAGPDQVNWLILVSLGADVIILFLNFVFTGILYGWQLYRAKNAIDVIACLINAGLVFIFLPRAGLTALVATKALTDTVALTATIAVCKRTFPALSIRLRWIAVRAFRELFSFGGRLFVSSTMARISNYTQPIIITSGLSAAATSYFAIPRRLVDYVKDIHWTLAAGFMPVFSDFNRRGQTGEARDLYLRYSRYILLLMFPMLVLLYLYGEGFIAIWIGPEFARAGRIVLYLLATGYLVELLQPLLWSLLIGIGRLNEVVIISSASAVLSTVASIVLIGPMGIEGVALAAFGSSAVAQVFYTLLVCRQLGMTVWEFSRRVYLGPVLATVLFLFLARLIAGGIGHASYGAIALGLAADVALYVPLALIAGLTRTERTWVGAKIRILAVRRP